MFDLLMWVVAQAFLFGFILSNTMWLVALWRR